MVANRGIGVCSGLAALALAVGGFADTTPHAGTDHWQSRIAELEAKSALDDARIAQLEARLSTLESDDDDGWLTEQRAGEIRSLVADVLADADRRASLLRGPTAGYDDGAVLGSSDGKWLLRTNIHMQQRFMLSDQSNGPGDSSRWGFENTRTKFILTGNVVSPQWFYKIEIDVADVNRGLPDGEDRTGLGDSFVGYDLGEGWKVGGGTFKTPLLREELVDSRYQLAVERSVVNYLYTGGRTDGIEVEYYGGQLHFLGSFNNGINDGVYGGDLETGGTSPLISATADFAFSVRGEWLIEGEWDRMVDFTSLKDEKTAVMIGGAMHYQIADDDAPGVADVDLLILTLDFSGKFGSANVFGSLIRASADRGAGSDIDATALVLQGGYRFTDDWEGFARYEWSDPDTLAASDVNIFTVGFTKYFARHNAKWTTDIGIGVDPVPFDVPVTGWRADAAGEDGQVVIRSQFQFIF
ncbi:MAG: porin [Planctomycetota bacterium]|jgi:hypothetical protein